MLCHDGASLIAKWRAVGWTRRLMIATGRRLDGLRAEPVECAVREAAKRRRDDVSDATLPRELEARR